jgi:hypothetical protein
MIWLRNFILAAIILDLFAQILLKQKKDWGANLLQVLIFVFCWAVTCTGVLVVIILLLASCVFRAVIKKKLYC